MPPVHDAAFTSATHTPNDLRDEVSESGLRLESLLSVEGIAFALGDLDDRLDNHPHRVGAQHPPRYQSIPDLLGVGPHMLQPPGDRRPDGSSFVMCRTSAIIQPHVENTGFECSSYATLKIRVSAQPLERSPGGTVDLEATAGNFLTRSAGEQSPCSHDFARDRLDTVRPSR